MRRIPVLLIAVLAMFCAAQSASAGMNRYSVALGVSSQRRSVPAPTPANPRHKARKRPRRPSAEVAVGYAEELTATVPGSNRPALLLDISTRIYGLRFDPSGFRICPFRMVYDANSDRACPPGAMVGSGDLIAAIGPQEDFSSPGTPCDPALHVWNSGGGRLTFFPVENRTHVCLGGALTTGAFGPYTATARQQGRYLVVDVPVPRFFSFPFQFESTSVQAVHLELHALFGQVGDEPTPLLSSTGCRRGRRPYAVTVTAMMPAAAPVPQTGTVYGSDPC
jgi:hypothetical protein